MEDLPKVDVWDMVWTVATTRIAMPSSMVRLSAGRIEMSEVEQAWCFMVGANSIFTGERPMLLVTPNPVGGSGFADVGQFGIEVLK